jgi:hypothetical protein
MLAFIWKRLAKLAEAHRHLRGHRALGVKRWI